MKYIAKICKIFTVYDWVKRKNHYPCNYPLINEYTMNSHKVFLVFTIVLLYVAIFVHSVSAMEKKSIFETIQKFDDIYEKGVSTSGRHVSTTPPIFWGQTQEQTTDYEWRYTQSGSNKSVLETSKVVPKISKDRYVTFHRQVLLFDQKRSGKKLVTLLPNIPIQEYADSQDISNAVLDLHAPNAEVLSLQIDMFLFALGRGVSRKIAFSDDINIIESVDRHGELCILLTGTGYYRSGNGTWECHVLPNAAYMLRHAKYSRDDDIMLEIETFGLNRKNDCFFPEKAEIRIPLGNKSIIHSFVFTSADLEFDSELFDRVTREFDEGELPDGSIKMDSSSGKDTIQLVGGESPADPFTLKPRPVFYRFLFIGGVNLIGISLILYLYFRNRRKK
jgi:hypothetical protein